MNRLLGLLLALPPLAAAAPQSASPSIPLFGPNGGARSTPMQIAIGLTLLTLVPAIVMTVSPFLRIVIVLHFLRQALGTQTTPSNQVIVGLALFLTILVMQQVIGERFMNPQHRAMWQRVDEPEEVLPTIRNTPDWDENAREFAVVRP